VSRRSARSARRASAGAEQAQDLAVVRPAAFALLREDQLAVGDDVVLGLPALVYGGVESVVSQLGRETRGPFVVPASDGAVQDLDGHAGSVAGAGKAALRGLCGLAQSRVDLVGEVRILLLEPPELGPEEHEHPGGRSRRHRRSAPAVAEDRELAEEVAGA
jgi:hypothetical protein